MKRPIAVSLAAAFLFVSALAAAPPMKVQVTSDQTLPASAASALDIRWLRDGVVVLRTAVNGIFEMKVMPGVQQASTAATTGTATVHQLLTPGTGRAFQLPAHLALSNQYFVTGSLYGDVAWSRRDDLRHFASHRIGVISDVDVFGDRVVVLGGERDARMRWSPDGAIAWTGTLSHNLEDLHPILFADDGPQTKLMGFCDFLDMGGVRFLADGSFIVVPGVQPGILLFDRNGKFVRQWDSPPVPFEDRCTQTLQTATVLREHPNARVDWLNRRRMLDEVVALPSGPALVIRSINAGHALWDVVPLDGSAAVRLPVTGSPQAHVKIDARGDRLAILVAEYAYHGVPQLQPPRVVTAKLTQ